MLKSITEHYRYNPWLPINYTWTEQINYHNPISAVKRDGYNYWFKLKSGDKTDKSAADDGFIDLDWTEINSL